MTARVVDTSSGPVEVCDTGSGPAVLVVHGMPGDWRQAITVAEDLSAQCRVLLVSRPGYGRTPLSSGRTPAASADLYAALLDVLEVPDAVVLGVSGGGPSSYALAARHPSRVRGLVLCCALQPQLIALPAAMRRVAAVPGLWPLLATASRARARRRPPASPPVESCTAREQALLAEPSVRAALDRFTREQPSWTSGTGLRNDVRQIQAAADPAPWPSDSPVRVHLLHGDLDEVVTLSHAEDYARRVPGATLEVLPGLGHAVPLFARARLNEVLQDLVGHPADPARHELG